MDLDKIYDIYVKSLESYDKEQDKSEECTGRKKRKIPVRKGSQTKKNVKKI